MGGGGGQGGLRPSTFQIGGGLSLPNFATIVVQRNTISSCFHTPTAEHLEHEPPHFLVAVSASEHYAQAFNPVFAVCSSKVNLKPHADNRCSHGYIVCWFAALCPGNFVCMVTTATPLYTLFKCRLHV